MSGDRSTRYALIALPDRESLGRGTANRGYRPCAETGIVHPFLKQLEDHLGQ